jgi:hypothetical protein
MSVSHFQVRSQKASDTAVGVRVAAAFPMSARMARVTCFAEAAARHFPTSIAGRNFSHVPELTWRHGSCLVLWVVAEPCSVLFVGVRRASWI